MAPHLAAGSPYGERTDVPRADNPTPLPRLRVVGIDPGATTALVCIEVVALRLDADGTPVWPDEHAARFVGSAALSVADKRTPAMRGMTDAERRAALRLAVADVTRRWLCPWPDAPAWQQYRGHVAVEFPADVADHFASKRRKAGTPVRRGTSVTLGAHYGLALAGAAEALRYARPVGSGRLFDYPVQNVGALRGWMQSGDARPQAREDVLRRVGLWLRSIGGPALNPERNADQDPLCAAGVARFHLAELARARLLALAPEIKAQPLRVRRGPKALG